MWYYYAIILQNAANYDPMFNNMNLGPRTTIMKSHPPPGTIDHDDWEVSPTDIVVDVTLGEGAFGEVYKGFLKGPITCSKVKPTYRNAVHVSVAIKLLKGP